MAHKYRVIDVLMLRVFSKKLSVNSGCVPVVSLIARCLGTQTLRLILRAMFSNSIVENDAKNARLWWAGSSWAIARL
jgi:hypothetical protein